MTDIIKGWRHNDQRYNLIGTKCNDLLSALANSKSTTS